MEYWLYPRDCDGNKCAWWVCANVIDSDDCYKSDPGGFLYNEVKVECPHHYNTSDPDEQWKEIPETQPVADGQEYVRQNTTDNRNEQGLLTVTHLNLFRA